MPWEDVAALEFAGITLLDASIMLGIVAILVPALLIVRGYVRRYRKRLASTDRTEILEVPAEVFSHTSLLFIVAISFAIAFQWLDLPPRGERIARVALTIIIFWQIGVWATRAVVSWLELKRKRTLTTDRAVAGSLAVLGFIAKTLIWALLLLVTLDNLGVNVTALVAGLGIGGIAVALAVQNVLGDVLASLSITLDKPFVIGDFLVVDDFLGTVDYIGIKTTRLKSLGGEQIILSNADLLGSRVRNFGRMAERRVVFTVGVTYETPADKLEQIPGVLREVIESQADTRFDRSHFTKHADFAIEFESVYHVLSANYNHYADIQQAINLGIHRAFERMGIEFAYPTQKLLLERVKAVA